MLKRLTAQSNAMLLQVSAKLLIVKSARNLDAHLKPSSGHIEAKPPISAVPDKITVPHEPCAPPVWCLFRDGLQSPYFFAPDSEFPSLVMLSCGFPLSHHSYPTHADIVLSISTHFHPSTR